MGLRSELDGQRRRSGLAPLGLLVVLLAAAGCSGEGPEPALGSAGAEAEPAPLAPPSAPAPPEPPEIGERVRAFRFLDARSLSRDLAELGPASAYVITFTANACPVAQRYLPRLAALERDLGPRGARFLLLNVGPDDALVDAVGLARDAGIDYPVGRDLDGEAVAALAPRRTPETVVLDADLRLRYRGRVDGEHRLGGARPAGREDLRLAVEEVLGGKPVTVAETPVDGCLITPPLRAPSRAVTFTEVLPILQRSCQPCHSEPLEAPFSLVTYEDAQGHSAMIAEVVEQRRMPPWFADGRFGAWENDRRLSSAEIRTVLDWVYAGAPRGDAGVAPAPERKAHPPADLALRTETFDLPAEGVIPYATVPLRDASGEVYTFPEDTWAARIAVVPSNPRALHHARIKQAGLGGERFLGGYVPGTHAVELGTGVAFRIPKGARLEITLHHVATGLPESSAVTVELAFPRGRVAKEVHSVELAVRSFEIPPGERAFELAASAPLPVRARGVALFSHMHLRGRDMAFDRLPDSALGGDGERLLFIPSFSFDWQLIYYWRSEAAPLIEAGSVIRCTAHYDNSAFNPLNPDPTSAVHQGEQTEDEMMVGILMAVAEDEELDLEVDPRTGWAVGD